MTLYVVIPCYNEEEVLELTAKAVKEKLDALRVCRNIDDNSRILFVDDGSKDSTWNQIERLHKEDALFTGIKLSRNRGHQNALLAGLYVAKERADVVISMDADLQDDVNAIDGFIEEYQKGCEIVYGVRKSRKKDTFLKRFSAQMFYKLLRFFGADIVYNHADYRLMSKKALQALFEFKEVNLFLRGIVPMIGYKTGIVYYERDERRAGTSKYPLKKMIEFATDGITSLSIKPINMIISGGMICFLVSIAMLIYSITQHFLGNTVSGWTSLITSIWALGGLQMICIGVVGKYIGKIYLETKERPRFIIEADLEM